MKSILLGAAVAGMLMVSAPTQSVAGPFGFFTSNGPSLPASSWQAKQNTAYSIFSPLSNSAVPPRARAGLGILNKVIFGATTISQFSKFFGIDA